MNFLCWRSLRYWVLGLMLGFLPLAHAGAIHDVRGFLPDLRFTLEGPGGKTVTQQALLGKTAIVYFGYTNCPDVCPTTLAQLAQITKSLGSLAKNVRVVFISVDPHRDTPDRMQAYVHAFFDKDAMGLTGTDSQIADVARRYRVAYKIDKPKPGGDGSYEVSHSRGIYIFDGKGRARLLASDSESAEDLTRSLRALLTQAAG